MYVSTSRVAQELGLSRRRVTELVRTGGLEATNVAGRWVIDAAEVAKYRVLNRVNGRPWDSDLSWEMITAISGLGGEISTRAELRLLNTDALTFVSQIHRLITVEWFQARNIDEQSARVFLTADSAISLIDHDVLGTSSAMHLYTDIADIPRAFDAVSYVQGNLAVYRWRDGKQRVVGNTPSILIAIDAARSTDARVRAAGIEFVEQELRSWQEIHSQ